MKTKLLFLIPAASVIVATLAFAGPQSVQTAQISTLKTEKANSAISYPATVVELFTSQGCSSCPPANKMVHDVAGSQDLLALTYSVDYWDYLGWKDTLGSPQFSERQRKYGKTQFMGAVYTPQIILNGDTHAARYSSDQMREHKLKATPANVTLNRIENGLAINAGGQSGTLIEVRYTPGSQSVPVSRGENRGQTITLANVVTTVNKLGSWNNGDEFEAVINMPTDGEAIAVLVQDGEGGPILTAANYRP